MVKFIMFK